MRGKPLTPLQSSTRRRKTPGVLLQGMINAKAAQRRQVRLNLDLSPYPTIGRGAGWRSDRLVTGLAGRDFHRQRHVFTPPA
jgi:hypothetical protein